MAYPDEKSARQNGILAALTITDYTEISEDLEPIELLSGQVIDEPGQSGGFVYFPVNCTASLVSSTQDGEMSELAITGREGLVGVACVLGMRSMNHRAVVMCAGQAFRMSSSAFESALSRSEAFRRLTLRYVQALMAQMAQSIVCSRHHSVLQRLSFWLLFNQDRAEIHQLKVTHETIAHMLGVRRESITQAAGLLQSSGWIRTSRGKISIENSQGLSSHSCECYGLVKAEYDRLKQPLAAEFHTALGAGAESAVREPRTSPVEHLLVQNADDRKYADIYDFAPVGQLSVDLEGRLLQVNMAGAILLGIQRSRAASHMFTDFLLEKSQTDFVNFHAEVMSGKCRRHCELTLAATAQRPLVVVRIHATVDEDGCENRMVMFDVTEQVRQTQALAEREREQRALLGHLPGVFWIKDESGKFVAVNHLVQRSSTDAAEVHTMVMPSENLPSIYGAVPTSESAQSAGLNS